MESSTKNKIVFIYFLSIALVIIFLYCGNIYSLSVDLAHNYTLVNKIFVDGAVSTGYQDNLGEMRIYPPLAHKLSAFITHFTDSGVISMNILVLLSFAIIYYIIAYFLLEVNITSFVIAMVVFAALFFSKIPIPLIGGEIISPYYFSQFVSQAYFFCVIFLLYRYKNNIIYQLTGLTAAIFLGIFIHLLYPVILLGTSIIIIMAEQLKQGKIKRVIPYILIFSIINSLIILFNPYARGMEQISSNNGNLVFRGLSNSGLDLSLLGILSIILCILLSCFSLWYFKDKKILHQGRERILLFVSAIIFSSSCLSFLQFILLQLGKGSYYAVKKYFFCMFTFLLIFIIILFSQRIEKILKNSRFTNLSLLNKDKAAVFLLPLFALILSIILFSNPIFYVRDLLNYQNQAKHYYEYHHVGKEFHDTITQLPIPSVLNYLITIGDLQYPRNDIAYNVLSGSIKNTDTVDYNVIVDENYSGAGILYDSGRIRVIDKNEYYSNVIDKGQVIYFNTPSSNKYLKSGFSYAEKWGTWSEGETSEIEFVLKKLEQHNIESIEFEVSPWVVENHSSFDTEIMLNGKLLDKWSFNTNHTYPEKRVLRISDKLIGNDGKVHLEFRYDNVKSPLDLNLSGDSRKLSLGFISMKVN